MLPGLEKNTSTPLTTVRDVRLVRENVGFGLFRNFLPRHPDHNKFDLKQISSLFPEPASGTRVGSLALATSGTNLWTATTRFFSHLKRPLESSTLISYNPDPVGLMQ